jgi:hypothetical protein
MAKKTKQQASNIFAGIVKASVAGNPTPEQAIKIGDSVILKDAPDRKMKVTSINGKIVTVSFASDGKPTTGTFHERLLEKIK